ncbi:hypothetical protein [Clostridium sp.]|uniref:hypothetical protein n=1 Tax=Clostridium sp. TaxID=1506 RepID=UPI0026263C5F|nr:hypothetical protein [Clostridium sp.]
MVKNTDVKNNLHSVGKGILDSLKDTAKDINNKDIQEQNISNSNKEINNMIEDESNKNIINENINTVNNNSKIVKKNKEKIKEKNKRSFMLNDTAIQQLKMLNLALDDKDLGDIVIDAIDMYYRKNEKKVEQVITNMFNGLKR